MKRPRSALVLLLSSVWLGLADARGLMAQMVPLGPEVQFFTSSFPSRPLVAVRPGGSSLIFWDDDGLANLVFRYIVPWRRPVSGRQSELFVPEGRAYTDAVTALPNGFHLIWHVMDDEDVPTFYRLHLNLRGVPDGRAVRLGRGSTDWVWHVRGNEFMAGWALPNQHGIAARRLNSSGRPTGPELRLNSQPVDEPQNTVVLAAADGSLVAVWLGTLPGSTTSSSVTRVLRARRFSPAGQALGPDFDVSTTPLLEEPESFLVDPDFQVAAAPGGGFAVAWLYDSTVYLRFFDAAGQALGPEIPVTGSSFKASSIAFDEAGNLLLLWAQDLEDGRDLFLQLFDPHGAPLGSPVSVRSRASDIYTAPLDGRVAWAGDAWIVTWLTSAEPTLDFSTIFMRRFAETAP